MYSSHTPQNIVSSIQKRKRGRPRKDEVVGTSNTTSTHVSLGERRPVGRPRKNTGSGASNPSNTTSQLIPPPPKKPVGRPRKVPSDPNNDCEVMNRGQFMPLIVKTTLGHGTYDGSNGQFRPLLPTQSNQYASTSNSSLVQSTSSLQLTMALHVIEFQKRGLPHAHMVIWLHPDDKPKTIQQVDQIVSAEIPDKQQDPHGYDAVEKYMIHGPCGELNNLSPCMDLERRTCTRHFPKRSIYNNSGLRVWNICTPQEHAISVPLQKHAEGGRYLIQKKPHKGHILENLLLVQF